MRDTTDNAARDLFRSSSAVLSACGTYRYRLERRWSAGQTCLFIMLNPSTADAEMDDPTIRRCIGFAKREGCGSLCVVNLFAYRSTDPANLPASDVTAVGPENLRHIMAAASEGNGGPVIAAWGAHPRAARVSSDVKRALDSLGVYIQALKLTKAGAPGHPLYVKGDAALVGLAPTSAATGPRAATEERG